MLEAAETCEHSMWAFHVNTCYLHPRIPRVAIFKESYLFFQTIILGIHVSFRECKVIPNRHSTESFQMIFTFFRENSIQAFDFSNSCVFGNSRGFICVVPYQIPEMPWNIWNVRPDYDFGPQGVKIFRKILDHSTDPMNQSLPFWIKRYLGRWVSFLNSP